MRVLFTIPHYVRLDGQEAYSERRHGALETGAETRAIALVACLTALHQLFRPARSIIDHCRGSGRTVPAGMPHAIDVVVCTTGSQHVLDRLPIPARCFTHQATAAVPELL